VEFEVEFKGGDGPAHVELSISGVPTTEGFRLLNERLTSDPHFRAGLRLLVDCSALDTSDLVEGEVQVLTQHVVERDWTYAPSAVALIAPTEEIARAVRAYRAHVGGSKSNRNLFTNRAEAIAWLEDQRA
jgi:hypothetical protein